MATKRGSRAPQKANGADPGNPREARNEYPPIGTILPFAGSKAPPGYLFCHGQELSRHTYSQLFDQIGETYGAGDGRSTFLLCDLRGRTIVGAGAAPGSGLTLHKLGEVFGEERHTLLASEMPKHFHSGKSDTVGGHNHTNSISASGAHNHGGNVGGGDHAHSGNTDRGNPMAYRLVFQAGKSTLENHVSGWAGGPCADNNDDQYGGSLHTHPFQTGGGGHSHGIAQDQGHGHTLSLSPAGDHLHSFTTAEMGGGGPHNNVPPSCALEYIIRADMLDK